MNFQPLWDAFSATPVEFLSGVFGLIVLTAGVVRWYYDGRLSTSAERLQHRDDIISDLQKELAAKPQAIAASPTGNSKSLDVTPKSQTFFDARDGGVISAHSADIDAGAGRLFTDAFAKADGLGSRIEMGEAKITRQSDGTFLVQPGPAGIQIGGSDKGNKGN